MDHRDIIKKCISEVLSKHEKWAELSAEKREKLVRHIERSCYNRVIAECRDIGTDRNFNNPIFVERYSSCCYRVMSNLDPDSLIGSTHALDMLFTGKIKPSEIATMSSYDLCPDASADIVEWIKLRREQKAELKVSHIYTCRKCGGNETVKIEFQRKAADEASSFSIKCVRCQYVWQA